LRTPDNLSLIYFEHYSNKVWQKSLSPGQCQTFSPLKVHYEHVGIDVVLLD